MEEEKQITIQVNLSNASEYINSELFKNYLFSTTDISTSAFILEVLNKTIKYMMEDING